MPTTWGSYAKTATTMDSAWTGTLAMPDLETSPIDTVVSVAALGGVVSISFYGGGSVAEHPIAGWPAAAVAAAQYWIDNYNNGSPTSVFRCYAFTASVPGTGSDTEFYCVGATWDGALFTWVGPYDSFSSAYNINVDNVVLKVRGGDSHPATRQVRDFIDQHVDYGWFVTAASTSTATLATPGGSVSQAGSWGSMPGVGPLASGWEVGFGCSYTITYGAGSALNTVYCTITPQWVGVDLKLDALDDRYYDAAWHHWWDGSEFQSPWPPAGKTAIWQADGLTGTIRLRMVDASGTTMTWTGSSGVPYILAVKIESGKWDDAGGDW